MSERGRREGAEIRQLQEHRITLADAWRRPAERTTIDASWMVPPNSPTLSSLSHEKGWCLRSIDGGRKAARDNASPAAARRVESGERLPSQPLIQRNTGREILLPGAACVTGLGGMPPNGCLFRRLWPAQVQRQTHGAHVQEHGWYLRGSVPSSLAGCPQPSCQRVGTDSGEDPQAAVHRAQSGQRHVDAPGPAMPSHPMEGPACTARALAQSSART